MFTQIFNVFTNLRYLSFDPSSVSLQGLSFYVSPSTIISSTLLELHVDIESFNDCLYLLDDRFNQLHTLYVNILIIIFSPRIINNKDKISNLRLFSLHCNNTIFEYDQLGVPLLHRMLNLENLNLLIRVNRDKGLIENNQHTFKYFHNNQTISCVDYFEECKYVTEVGLYDERPFEHEFFLRIAQSFPSMEKLTVVNRKSQIDKRCIKSINDNQDLSIIKYPHLTKFFLEEAHDDCIEQSLVDTKMCLPNNVFLFAVDRSLERVARNFERGATRNNCEKVSYLSIHGISLDDEHIKHYFPHAHICSNLL
ncbi:unnamed protein product [Rotaria sp. Silwood2]|nr:unnamed protein product [Rotaria sp. Silwood2]